MIHLAIVGLGPWGLAALDRAIAAARRRPGLAIAVTAIDAGPPGPGVHDPDDSALMLLNTVAGQVDSFGAGHFGEPALPGALPFLAWARRNGCADATADTFLPRALFGRYLAFVFGVLRDAAPRNLELTVVRDQVVAIEQCPGARARCALRGGGEVVADRVLLCTGHGLSRAARELAERPPVPAPLAPYPVARLDAAVAGARSVGLAGMGLVAVDVVAALTEGRGGRFERVDGALAYRPSGREPLIFPFSRTGIPFSCRPVSSRDLATVHDPVHCTDERVAALRARTGLDLVRDVLSPIFAEMRAAYGLRALALRDGDAAADALHRRLRATDLADAAAVLERAVPEVAGFRPEALVLAERLPVSAPAGFRDAFVRRLAFDVAEARKGEAASPFKAGTEMLRVVRHAVRAGVEHGRLAPASRALFHRVVAPRIAQLIVGPPVSRGEEWLALIDAGILRLDLGAAPAITRNWTRGKWRAATRGASLTAATHLDCIIQGYLDDDSRDAARGGLWQALCADGLCAVGRDSGRPAPRITVDGRLIDATGQVVPTVHAFGVPTEGPTYFNHYLPSPRSRADAFERLRDVIEAALDGADQNASASPPRRPVSATARRSWVF
jgi:hypothetical protein